MGKSCTISDAKLRSLKPRDKPYQIYDGDGLYIEVAPCGSKIWRVKKIIDGKVVRRSIGKYPAIDLKTAREKRAGLEKSFANGLPNPASNLVVFSDLFNEWKIKHTVNYSQSTLKMLNLRVAKYILPQIGHVKLNNISPQLILNALLRPIEATGYLETASKVKVICGQVLRYGVALGVVERDFTQDLKGALAPVKVQNRPAITDPPQIANLMRSIFTYKCNLSVVYALRILPYVFVRPGELRAALWEEFNFEDKTWRIPAEKMKMRRPHLVPLVDQVVTMLTKLKRFTGQGRLLFPGARVKDRPISDMTLTAALRVFYWKWRN